MAVCCLSEYNRRPIETNGLTDEGLRDRSLKLRTLLIVLTFLDISLTILHGIIILFNLIGWIWKKTRRFHLIILLMTITSWLVLGAWHGLGYCFLTDWHWQVKGQLGEHGLPNSFIKYAVDLLVSRDIDPRSIDIATAGTMILISILTIWVHSPAIRKKLIR
ncbi:MAG: DUF2784 domain-containing protein [Saprospiraceae bacterium]|nr:DUF2784 domain-containing protein [Saprospiraceae bacterium]